MKAFRSKMKGGFTLVEIMIVVLIIGILLAIAIPNFVAARESSRAKACVGNLKQIDSAAQQYAMDNKMAGGAPMTGVTIASLCGSAGYIRVQPSCPEGGTYSLGATPQDEPFCSISDTGSHGGGGGTETTGTGSDPTDYGAGGKWYHGLSD